MHYQERKHCHGHWHFLNDLKINGIGGNDLLDGQGGGDLMAGGLGDDTYFVDNAGDVVFEQINEGVDQIYSAITYILPDDVENLTLTGSAGLSGIGNTLNNVLTGNSGNNILDGGEGADSKST